MRKLVWLILVVFGLFLLAGCTGGESTLQSGYMRYATKVLDQQGKVLNEGQEGQGRFMFTGEKMKIEFVLPGVVSLVEYIDGNKSYKYDADLKLAGMTPLTAEQLSDKNPFNMKDRLARLQAQKLGEEKVGDILCAKYSYADPAGGMVVVWVDAKGLPQRIQKTQGSGVLDHWTFDIRINEPVDVSLVTLPAGTKIVSEQEFFAAVQAKKKK
jgi:hypothetical protein